MTLDAKRLALAAAVVTAILWLLCSASVSLAPAPMMTITGYMVHADLSEFSWSLSWGAVLVGLVAWTISTTVAAWLLAWTYNHLSGAPSP
jgi:2TM family of unknown function (DUF5676)